MSTSADQGLSETKKMLFFALKAPAAAAAGFVQEAKQTVQGPGLKWPW